MPGRKEKVHSGALCPCWDGSPEAFDKKCLHPYAVIWQKRQPRFKDEPQDHTKRPSCQYKEFRGYTTYQLGSMTEEEYDNMIASYTYCYHPEEFEDGIQAA